jgi:uncharacterized membrane protein HdeD (DUF308 family)
MTMRSGIRQVVADATGYWWVLLITGCIWILLSLAILQFDLTSVWSIAILTGIVLWMAALTEFYLAWIALGWRWAHAILGVLFLIGGIVAFAWPGETFLVLARLIAWYLLFLGTFEVIEALSSRRTDLWWLRLIAGAATVAVAFWAVHSLSRSVTLLVLWVGLGALFRGVDQLFLAFEYRRLHEETKAPATAA